MLNTNCVSSGEAQERWEKNEEEARNPPLQAKSLNQMSQGGADGNVLDSSRGGIKKGTGCGVFHE